VHEDEDEDEDEHEHELGHEPSTSRCMSGTSGDDRGDGDRSSAAGSFGAAGAVS
jgi:hypothetical protein